MRQQTSRQWLVLLGLAFGVCISNGFARFAYGLILPAMQAELGWSYAQAGWINTANALGYVFGAVATFALITRISPSRLFSVGVLGTSVFLLASGFTIEFWTQSLWRVLAGLFGAFTFVSGGTLAAALFQDNPKRNALAIALYFGGGGLGMILSGATLPALFAMMGNEAWPIAWVLLGVASLLACPLCLWASGCLYVSPKKVGARASLPIRQMAFLLAGYGLFAMGYIVYVTFLVAWMKALSLAAQTVALVWIVVGLGIVVSPFVWRSVLARYSSGAPLAMATATTAVGTAMPVIWPTTGGILLSAAVFGLAVFIAPSAATSFFRKNLLQHSWGSAMSLFTILFAIGQTVGPIAAGFIADSFGSISYGLMTAGVILLLGAFLASCQRSLSNLQVSGAE